MSLPGTIPIPIAFSGGLNSKAQEFTLDQPNLQEAENCVYNQIGQIDKRTGFTCVSTNIQGGGNISEGACLTTFNNELLLLDGTNLYSYQQESDLWINRGTAIATINDQVRVLNTKVATQSGPDCSSLNSISVYAWEDNRVQPASAAGVRYQVINNQTGTIIVSDTLVYSNAFRPKVLNDGMNNFYIIYCASSEALIMNTIPVSACNTISPFDILIQDGLSTIANEATIPYDACIFNGSPLVAYASITGLRTSINEPFPIVDSTTIQVVGICVDSLDQIWIVYCDGINTYVMTCTYDFRFHSLTTIMGPIAIGVFGSMVSINLSLIEGLDKGSLNLTAEVAQSGAENINNNCINNFIVNVDGYYTFIGQQRGVGLASKPFNYNNQIYVNTLSQSSLQSTYLTQCLTQGTGFTQGTTNLQSTFLAEVAVGFSTVAKHSPTTGGNYRTNGLLSQCDPINENTFIFAGQRKGPFTSYQNAQVVNLGVAGYSIDYNNQNQFNNVQSNNNLHLVGGIKKIYDGISCVEDNFNIFPENADGYGCSISLISGTSLNYNPLAPSFYQYIVVYEWTDNEGQVQRSGPSVANGITTTAAGQGAMLTGPMLRLTEKVNPRTGVIISIYRTQDSLPIFYKITDDNDPLVNDTTVDTWTFYDISNPDTIIASDENIYTNSQLGNSGPPSCSLISTYQNRLMINSNEDPGVIWFSQNKFEQDQYNTLSLDWNTTFVEGIDSNLGNEITAIGRLDAQLAIFKPTSIFLLSGDGPNALATSDQFNDAQLLVSDTGCTNQNSLCFITQTPNSPGGLLFKSPKGIYLLGRDESITYIGAPVEKYNNLTITAAILLSQSNQVVFTTLEGTALVYNYFFNAWTTWTNLPAVSACVWQDQLCILRENGEVSIQDITNTVWQDTHLNNVIEPIVYSVKTPWIKMNGLQGYQSVYSCLLLGTLQGPHVLSCQVAYDYNSSIKGSVLINSNVVSNRWGGNTIWGAQGLWGNNQFANYQFQINIDQPRCEAIQFTFSDINNPTYSQGFSLNGLVLECQAHAGTMRMPRQNIFGVKK
jgi:hypothetical protein